MKTKPVNLYQSVFKIQQFQPAFDNQYGEGNVKLTILLKVYLITILFFKYENDELIILIQNVPIDADIFNAKNM